MPSPRSHRPHPLIRAGTAAEHFILRHFGFRLMPEGKGAAQPSATPGQERRDS